MRVCRGDCRNRISGGWCGPLTASLPRLRPMCGTWRLALLHATHLPLRSLETPKPTPPHCDAILSRRAYGLPPHPLCLVRSTSARCCTFSTRSKHTAPFHRLRPRSRPSLRAPRCPRQATSPVAWCNDVGALGLTASGECWATGEWGMVWFRIFSLLRAGIDYRTLLAWLAAGHCRALSPSPPPPSLPLSETLWRLTHSCSPCLCWSYLQPGRDARRAAVWRF